MIYNVQARRLIYYLYCTMNVFCPCDLVQFNVQIFKSN